MKTISHWIAVFVLGFFVNISFAKDAVTSPEEKKFLDSTKGIVTRKDAKTLEVRLKSGKSKTFSDNTSEGNDTIYYEAKKLIPEAETLLLHYGLYEGDGFLLVNLMTGKEAHLRGEPVWSPDFLFFAVAHDGDASQYTPDDLSVWSCVPPSRECRQIWQAPKYKAPKHMTDSIAYAGQKAEWTARDSVTLTAIHNEKTFTTTCKCEPKTCKCTPELKP